MFNPSRLTLARQRRGLSSRALAEMAGITPVTLSRIENGKNAPEPDTVRKLTLTLDFPEEFFFGETCEAPSPEGVSFRSMSSMTARERDSSRAAAPFAYMVQDWVDARFNLPQPDLLDLSTERDPAAAARALREHWTLGEQPISHMIKLMESKGIRVFSLAEETLRVDGYSCWRDNTPYIFLNTMKSAERSRFDCAHELAHLVLHRHGGPGQGKQAEVEAQQFAASFLMPEADVRAKLPFVTSLDQIVQAKKRWGVSVSALAYRLHKLKTLSDWQYRGTVIELGKRGYRTTEPHPLEREESAVWKMVLEDLWRDRLTKLEIAKALGLPPMEVEKLLFGLLQSPSSGSTLRPEKSPKLRVVSSTGR
ncbi:ImmA/IrrE family metallo-endopeptidase [Gluconobacter sp. LMG 31484]|uniref:ImmA/IrrE family metallo-endopeptidase n=1 Tax=Gluconobacter vitians TaxID=2728102 RepID=A0ABR9Y476_9PROT|nr:XRE family transcriptional regulator [Gluconobacter vitians]MBF0858698.1 ImmA/IrrE family metallo-endopeptidase [Gluconobacter vitians]